MFLVVNPTGGATVFNAEKGEKIESESTDLVVVKKLYKISL